MSQEVLCLPGFYLLPTLGRSLPAYTADYTSFRAGFQDLLGPPETMQVPFPHKFSCSGLFRKPGEQALCNRSLHTVGRPIASVKTQSFLFLSLGSPPPSSLLEGRLSLDSPRGVVSATKAVPGMTAMVTVTARTALVVCVFMVFSSVYFQTVCFLFVCISVSLYVPIPA